MVSPATITDCPTAATAEEGVLDTTGRSLTVSADYCNGPALDDDGYIAAELFGWHGAKLYEMTSGGVSEVMKKDSPLGRRPPRHELDSGVQSRVYDFFMPQALESPRGTIQIGEAARRAKLTIDTIRFYERRELLPRAPRTEGRFRLYTTDDVSRLTFFRQMQGLGFSLQEIKQLLDLRDRGGHACGEVKDLLSSKLAEIRNKIRDLQTLEREMVLDLLKCDRELTNNRRHGPQRCPNLTSVNGRK